MTAPPWWTTDRRFPMGSASTEFTARNRRNIPRVAGDPPAAGVELAAGAPLVPAANVAFTPAELDARVAAHAARVEREAAAIAATQRRPPGLSTKGHKRLALDWKVCGCAGCSRRLFGESMAGTAGLPAYTPLVAGRVDGRPYCRACLRAARKRRA